MKSKLESFFIGIFGGFLVLIVFGGGYLTINELINTKTKYAYRKGYSDGYDKKMKLETDSIDSEIAKVEKYIDSIQKIK